MLQGAGLPLLPLPAINFVQRQLNGERRVIAGVSGCAAIEGGRS